MRQKIFLGIPCFDMVPPEILEDYMRFAYYLGRRYQEYDFFLGIKTKTEQFRARNELVKAALDVGVDYLLMIDDDHIIDYNETQWATNSYEFLKRLIGHIENNPKIGLVGCLYYERGNECRPVLMRKITPVNYEWLTDKDILGRLQPVDVQGGGVMLINMKVFDWLPGPVWFEPEHMYGTDVQICRKIQEAGFEVYSDTSIEIGHLRSQRMIVTSKNRHELINLNKDKDDQIQAISDYGRMVKQYRDDIKEYLGIDEKIAADMFLKYEEYWQPNFGSMPPEDWYVASSRDFLGRQVIVNNPEKPAQFYGMILDSVNQELDLKGLDFGCGTSVVGFELARRGKDMYFCDIRDSETYKFLKWRCAKYSLNGKARFIDAPIGDFADESLDFIMALDSIEHFPEKEVEGLIKKFASWLKPQGVLFSNFMTCVAFDFPEHLFMDKVRFMQIVADNGLFMVNHYTFLKEARYYAEDPCKSA